MAKPNTRCGLILGVMLKIRAGGGRTSQSPNERCCSQRHCGALCNCAALRAAPFTANLLQPLQQNAALERRHTDPRRDHVFLMALAPRSHDPISAAAEA